MLIQYDLLKKSRQFVWVGLPYFWIVNWDGLCDSNFVQEWRIFFWRCFGFGSPVAACKCVHWLPFPRGCVTNLQRGLRVCLNLRLRNKAVAVFAKLCALEVDYLSRIGFILKTLCFVVCQSLPETLPQAGESDWGFKNETLNRRKLTKPRLIKAWRAFKSPSLEMWYSIRLIKGKTASS